jgi:hypothetical protein
VTAQLAPHLGDLSDLSDAKRCAALWLAQMRAFADAIARMPNARALEAETFFNSPKDTLQAGAALLGVPMSEEAIREIAAGPLFASYSKNPDLPFDNEARLARRAEAEKQLSGEMAEAQVWVREQCGGAEPLTAQLAEARLNR